MLKKTPLASTLAILLAACADSHPAPSPAGSAPPPFPAIYNPELQPRPLTSSQFHEIQSRASHAHPAHIWFIYVAENDGTRYRVSVYFIPTSHNGRISHGKFANFLSATRDELDFMEKAGMSTVAIDNYTYITDHPTDDVPPPTGSNFPFRTPERIPDADLPKILDASRAFFTASHPKPATLADHPAPLLPVHSIVTDSSGNIQVLFGWQTAPLTGGGVRLELQRHGGDFAVINATE